jgi:hypothetical protein
MNYGSENVVKTIALIDFFFRIDIKIYLVYVVTGGFSFYVLSKMGSSSKSFPQIYITLYQ